MTGKNVPLSTKLAAKRWQYERDTGFLVSWATGKRVGFLKKGQFYVAFEGRQVPMAHVIWTFEYGKPPTGDVYPVDGDHKNTHYTNLGSRTDVDATRVLEARSRRDKQLSQPPEIDTGDAVLDNDIRIAWVDASKRSHSENSYRRNQARSMLRALAGLQDKLRDARKINDLLT